MERYLAMDRVQATPEKTGDTVEPPSREIKVSGRPIPEEIMDDLCSRFLLNIPTTEKDDMIRLMFQVELAHWFYIDFHRVEDPSLPEMRLPQFSARIFAAYPFLLKGTDNVSVLITKWREYKKEVPTYGAIIMDQKLTHCLLVQGSSEKSTWGFPKGKINIDEEPIRCAAREVFEEVGYDISNLIDKKDFIEIELTGQINRLYLCRGVPLSTKFETKTRNEIRGIKWFPVNNLPTHKKDIGCKEKLGMSAHNFFMVTPFAMQIRAWCQKRKMANVKMTKRRRRKDDPESSDENADDIPACHSIYVSPKKPSASESRKSAIQRRMQSRTSRINMVDSSDDEVIAEKSNSQSANKVKMLNQSPSATKRILRKHFPKADVKAKDGLVAEQHRHISLIPDRTYNKYRQQTMRVQYIPECWRTFRFDRNKIMNAMYNE